MLSRKPPVTMAALTGFTEAIAVQAQGAG